MDGIIKFYSRQKKASVEGRTLSNSTSSRRGTSKLLCETKKKIPNKQ